MADLLIKEKEMVAKSAIFGPKRCSSYDLDCATVPDHTRCFMGICGCNNTDMGVADGYCPFIHNKN